MIIIVIAPERTCHSLVNENEMTDMPCCSRLFVLLSALLATAVPLLQPALTKEGFEDVFSPFRYDAPGVEIPDEPVTRENVTATTTAEGQAKSLYESCHYHQECSYRSANMRCVDSVCYCPQPFELGGNGECLESRPSSGKTFTSVAPATILLVITLGIAVAFISRRLFLGGKREEAERDAEIPWNQNRDRHGIRPKSATMSRPRSFVPSPSVRRRLRALWENGEWSRSEEPPLPRIIRIPPDRWQQTSSSPRKGGSPAPSTSAKTSAATRASGSDKTSPGAPCEKSPLVQGPPLQEPPPLSAAWLAQKLLASNLHNAWADDDDGIVVRVQREDKKASAMATSQAHPPQRRNHRSDVGVLREDQKVSPTATSQSKPPQGRDERSLLPPSDSSSKTRATLREGEGPDEGGGSSSSLPIEWDTTLATRRGNSLECNLPAASATDPETRDSDEPANDVPFEITPSLLPFHPSRDVEKASSPPRYSLQPASVPIPKNADDATLAERSCVRLGSLKAETRWLSKSVGPPFSRARLALARPQQRHKSAPPLGASNASPVALGDRDISGQERKVQGQILAPDVSNRLGLATPFADISEDPLSDTASVALSFLSPTSSPSSDVTLPRPDIDSAMIRAADAVETDDDGVASKDLAGDARLVETFVASALEDASLSDGAPPPLPLSGADRAAHEEARVAMMVEARCVRATPSRPGSSARGWKVNPSSQTSLKRLFPIAARRGRNGSRSTTPNGHTKEVQADHSSSSSTDIDNLAEMLTSLKVAQLYSSHRRAERTLLREYSVGMVNRIAPAAAPSLPTRADSANGLRSTRSASHAAAVIDAPARLEDACEAEQTARNVETGATPAVPARFSVPEPAKVVVAVPELSPLTDSGRKRADKEEEDNAECASSEHQPPPALPSLSEEDETADATTSSQPPSKHRGRSLLAQLHRNRTANSRLVPPAAPTFRPAPQKRSIRFRRTASSQLQVIAEVLHSVETQAPSVPLRSKVPFSGEGEAVRTDSAKRKGTPEVPHGEGSKETIGHSQSIERVSSPPHHFSDGCAVALERRMQPPNASSHVHYEPLRSRSPFAVKTHTAEPLPEFQAAVSRNTDGGSSGGEFRPNERNVSAHSSVSPYSSCIDGGAYDTKAFTSSFIPTIPTTGGTAGRNELAPSIQGEPPSYCWSRFWSGLAAFVATAQASPDSAAIADLPERHASLSTTPEDTCTAAAGSEASDVATLKAFSGDRQGNVSNSRAPSTAGRSRPHEGSNDGGSTRTQASVIVPPAVPPRKTKNIQLGGAIGSTDPSPALGVPLPRLELDDHPGSLKEPMSKMNDTTELVVSAQVSANIEKKCTALLVSSSLKDWSSVLGSSEANTKLSEAPTVPFAPDIYPTMPSAVSRTATLSACETRESNTRRRRSPSLSSGSLRQATEMVSSRVGCSAASPTGSADGAAKTKSTASGTTTRSRDPSFSLEGGRHTDDGDPSGAAFETNGTFISGLYLSEFMKKLDIFPPPQLQEQPPSAAATDVFSDVLVPLGPSSEVRGSGSLREMEAPFLTLLPSSGFSAGVHCERSEPSTSFSTIKPARVGLLPGEEGYTQKGQVAPERHTAEPRQDPTAESAFGCCTPKATPVRGRPPTAVSDFYSCSSRLSERRPHFFISSAKKPKKSHLN
ncbi:streptococcal hemagglutinin-like isoform X2 [Dermacentor albipictus]|uniref:streptococcal hemagglutinin-like isoform X2 n=1 Tax=Dermacentor albipictus TaxID=60249 RepID=UPI0038FC7CDC